MNLRYIVNEYQNGTSEIIHPDCVLINDDEQIEAYSVVTGKKLWRKACARHESLNVFPLGYIGVNQNGIAKLFRIESGEEVLSVDEIVQSSSQWDGLYFHSLRRTCFKIEKDSLVEAKDQLALPQNARVKYVKEKKLLLLLSLNEDHIPTVSIYDQYSKEVVIEFEDYALGAVNDSYIYLFKGSRQERKSSLAVLDWSGKVLNTKNYNFRISQLFVDKDDSDVLVSFHNAGAISRFSVIPERCTTISTFEDVYWRIFRSDNKYLLFETSYTATKKKGEKREQNFIELNKNLEEVSKLEFGRSKMVEAIRSMANGKFLISFQKSGKSPIELYELDCDAKFVKEGPPPKKALEKSILMGEPAEFIMLVDSLISSKTKNVFHASSFASSLSEIESYVFGTKIRKNQGISRYINEVNLAADIDKNYVLENGYTFSTVLKHFQKTLGTLKKDIKSGSLYVDQEIMDDLEKLVSILKEQEYDAQKVYFQWC